MNNDILNFFQIIEPFFKDSGYPVHNVKIDRDSEDLIYELAVPGAELHQISITEQGNGFNRNIVIKRHTSPSGEDDNYKYIRKHIPQRKFAVSIPIPHGYEIDKEGISLYNGILTFRLSVSDNKSVEETFTIKQEKPKHLQEDDDKPCENIG